MTVRLGGRWLSARRGNKSSISIQATGSQLAFLIEITTATLLPTLAE